MNFSIRSKKKIETELIGYFPKHFENAKEKDRIADVIRLLNAKLDFIETRQDNSVKIKALEEKLDAVKKQMKKKKKKSIEVEYDKQFEAACLLISQKARQNPRVMTVLQFYSTLDNIESQLKAEQRVYKKHK